MAKDRKDRYRTPEELIVDLECLLQGEPPKFARQRLGAATLKGLSEGEVAEDDEDRPRKKRPSRDDGRQLEAPSRQAAPYMELARPCQRDARLRAAAKYAFTSAPSSASMLASTVASLS